VAVAEVDTDGNEFTVIVVVAVAVQPLALVTVTVYVPEVFTDIAAVVAPPGLQEYVPPPEAVNVAELPEQIELDGLTDMDAVGAGFTMTVNAAVLVQPNALVAVTV
jgi:hypothetical protein